MMLAHKAAICAAVLGGALIAAAPSPAEQVAQATPAAARAGVAAAVSGAVQLAAMPGVRQVGKDVVSGDPIFLGDKITTGPDGRLQIMLQDETVFTLGPKAALVVDKFVYDPSTNAGKVSATVLQGTFRFVSGKIAARQPSDMEVKLPVGSIGVRGTSVAGEVTGNNATVVLLGPGPENSGGERAGRIFVTGGGSAGAATTVEIVRPGFATTIGGVNVPPSPPVRLDPVRLAALTAPLAGTAPKSDSGQGSGQGGGARQGQQQSQSGQAQGVARPTGAAAQAVGSGPSVARQAAPVAAGSLAEVKSVAALVTAVAKSNAAVANAAVQNHVVRIPDGPTTFEQLHQIQVTSATISASGIPLSLDHGSCSGGCGTYSYTINVNFAAQNEKTTVIGSNINVGTTPISSFTFIDTESFGGKTGVIGKTTGNRFDSTTPSSNPNVTISGLPSTISGFLIDNPRNVGGKIAAVVDVGLALFDSTGTGATCATSANCSKGGRTIARQ